MRDGAVSSSGTMMEAPPPPAEGITASMEFDYMDELFFDGCWLSASPDGPDLLMQNPTFSNNNDNNNENPLFDPSISFPWTPLETMEPPHSGNHHQQEHEPQQLQAPLGTQQPLGHEIVKACDGCNNQQQFQLEGSSEMVRRWWIAPSPNPGPGSYSVMEKLIRALMCIKDVILSKDMLIQIWVPVNRGGRQILTTNGLPFSLEARSPNLAKYREISEEYQFSAEDESKGLVAGLPGRVFKEKVPEWTPDVRFFRSYEYPRVDHAQEYDVSGSLALPIFEQGSGNCLGVVEVVMTRQQIKYGQELESVCKALEAVDLRSSKLPTIQNGKACDKSYEAALPEILEVLRSAYEMHKLPLAQTWIPCIQQGKEGCRHSEDNYLHCISPVEHACYVGDPSIRFFHEVCSEHHLLKGQGVAGGAFLTNQPCFSTDLTALSKTDYPLSHHARMFGLRAAVAIRLRSIYNSTDDFVLEFFLPVNCNDSEEQKKMLMSLSLIIQRVCHSLRVVSDEELEEETNLSVDEVISLADSRVERNAEIWTKPHQNGTVPSLITEEKSSDATGRSFADTGQQEENHVLKGNVDSAGECSAFGEGNLSSVGISKTGEKKRTKAEKNITIQVLRQYFAGSLKDAAKNIGVCTTTLKRICRQHGIKRWPSRKIKKVGHSLQKLQLVIDSVQGASGAFQIDSFYSNFPDLASPNISGTSLFNNNLKQSDNNPNSLSTQPDPGGSLSPEGASKSPSSSCSQSSISSHPCSSMAEQQPHHTINVAAGGSGNSMLKRIRSEAELKTLIEDNSAKLIMSRSQSQEELGQSLKTEYHHHHHRPLSTKTNGKKEESHRVKVTYGDEKKRFRMPKNWGYEDLLQEVSRRFSISDTNKFDMKYLDDDCEWVLLTCDADVEECIDVCQSSENSTIKLCLQPSNHCLRNSFSELR